MQAQARTESNRIHFHDLHDHRDTMALEVHAGLSRSPKTLSPKFFYDRRGSQLFDQITALPEYYPTRTEVGLLKQYRAEMAELLGQGGVLLELGSGSSVKIRLLLETLQPDIYVPMDISREHLLESAHNLIADFPWLTVHAACIDFSQSMDLPPLQSSHQNAFFPGSSIGNFEPEQACELLRQIHTSVGRGGGLLIGVDLKKDPDVLAAAYNDAQGVTADFNLNMLAHINQRLNADFDLQHFSHQAHYNEAKGRVEMHLQCTQDHTVHINGDTYPFESGETIHTENSYKYSVTEFHQMARRSGFEPQRVWTDPQRLFSIHYLVAA